MERIDQVQKDLIETSKQSKFITEALTTTMELGRKSDHELFKFLTLLEEPFDFYTIATALDDLEILKYQLAQEWSDTFDTF